jgi:DegV family protein with EDD domain
VDTLEYLQKGGRIGKAQAVLGSLLNIKPILTIDDEGEVASVDKVRGTKKAVQRIVELYKQDYDPNREVVLDVVHSNDLPAAETVAEALRAQYTVRALQFVTLGPVIGVHTGPGTVGVFMRYAE